MTTDPRAAAWRPYLETTIRLQTVLDEDLRRNSGMSLSDYNILLTLQEAPGHRLRMRDLADRMVYSSSRLSYQVDTMTRRGWLCRERAIEDQRGSYAIITEAGRAAFARAAEEHLRCVDRLFIDALTPEDGRDLQRIMHRIGDGLENR